MSSLTLVNSTESVAQFVVKRGELVIARIPCVEPGGTVLVPTDLEFEVVAHAVIEPDIPVSASHKMGGALRFVANLAKGQEDATGAFKLVVKPSTKPDVLQFEKTCLSPVVFAITRDGHPLQNVVVNDTFEAASIHISNLFSVYAVINGTGTHRGVTSNPGASVTLTHEGSGHEGEQFALQIN